MQRGNAEVPEVDWSDTANTLPDFQTWYDANNIADLQWFRNDRFNRFPVKLQSYKK